MPTYIISLLIILFVYIVLRMVFRYYEKKNDAMMSEWIAAVRKYASNLSQSKKQ